MVSHLVRFAREGFLKSHKSLPSEERSPNGAILIHIDSHADMGLPPGLNHLPAAELFTNLPDEYSPQEMEILEHSEINDFLPFLGHMGIVEHIIFIEPPWAILLEHAHYTTVDISMGVVPGEEGVVYASIRNSLSSTFPDQDLSEYSIMSLRGMMSDPFGGVEVVEHEELLRHCLEESDECTIRTIRFTSLSYQGAAESIKIILDQEPDRDIILDIDLDGFSTTSPGALSLFHSTIPDYGVLTRIFHTAHQLCDIGKEYWERLKATGGSRAGDEIEVCQSENQNYVYGPPFEPPKGASMSKSKHPSDRARKLVEDMIIYFRIEDDKDTIRTLTEVFEHFLPAIDAWAYDDDKFIELLNAFLMQPFYIPESETIHSILDFHFDDLFSTIFEDRTPAVINVVRSPFYCPDHHLEFIECEVFDRLLGMFGHSSGEAPLLYHHEGVEVDRTKCLSEPNKFPPANRFNIGTNSNLDVWAWKSTHKTFTFFMEDDDEHIGIDYKFYPISLEFVNEHKHPLLVKHLHGESFLVQPGERMTREVHHMARWDLYRTSSKGIVAKRAFQTIYWDAKTSLRQSYGSKSGSIPVHYATPVTMKIENPADRGIHVALKKADQTERIPPGQVLTLYTVHGERWSIHGVPENDGVEDELLGEVIANATLGEVHSVRLFSDEGMSESEL